MFQPRQSSQLTGHGANRVAQTTEGGTTAFGEGNLATNAARTDLVRCKIASIDASATAHDGLVMATGHGRPVGREWLSLPSGNLQTAACTTAVDWDGILAAINDWRNNGFSVYLNGSEPPRNEETYFVSFQAYERVFDHPPTRAELEEYVSANIGALSQSDHFLGGWLNDGDHYLDVSVAIQGRERALQFAAKNDQKAVWHPVTMQSTDVAAQSVVLV
jgi:hypothetical protein